MKNFIKLLRFLIFLFSLIGLSFYIRVLYQKFKCNPDIISTQRIISSHHIPMPAITICSPIVMKNKYFNLSAHSKKLRENNFKSFGDFEGDKLLAICLQVCSTRRSRELYETNISINTENIVNILDKVAPTIDETIIYCDFQRKSIPCKKFLTRILHDDGFCFSANMLDMNEIFRVENLSKDFDYFKNSKHSQWSLEKSYKSLDADFPIRMLIKNRVQIDLKISMDDLTNVCTTLGKSFFITFHLPNEIPTHFHADNFVEIGHVKNINIEAKKIVADESLRSYSPEQRRCYFEGERTLQFFKSYKKNSCEFECLTNYTQKTCGCSKFSMPRTKNSQTCNFNSSKCLFDVIKSDFTNINENGNSPLSECGCLPSCTDIRYKVVSEKTSEYVWKGGINTSAPESGNSSLYTEIIVKFTSSNIVEEEKFVAYQLQDFTADCGGLGGLFLGFSILTVVNLIEKFFRMILKKEKIDEKQKCCKRHCIHFCNESSSKFSTKKINDKNIFVVHHGRK